MADRHQLDDCHWTGAALAAVLDHELYQDGQAPYRQVISTIPVLKAYQKFLKVEHVKELAQVMDEHRKTMQANWKAAADQPATGKAPREWTPENYLAWQKQWSLWPLKLPCLKISRALMKLMSST